MIELPAVIHNHAGIHCRPAGVITEKVRDYDGEITVSHGPDACDLQSILDLMTLALTPGDDVSIRVSGQDEESVCRMLVELFETHFDFPPQ